MKDNLNEEILRQLSLIKFDRSKTLLEQNEVKNNIIFRNDSITINEEVEKVDWCLTAEANKIKGELKDRGFFTIPKGYWEWKCQGLVYDETSGKYVHSGYNSLVEAKNDAAFSAMRYFTDLVTKENYFNDDLGVQVLSKGGTRFKFDKYGAYMINSLRSTLSSYNLSNDTKDIKYLLPATDKTTQFNPYDYDPESFDPFSKGLAFRPEEDKNLEVFPRSFFIDPNRTIYNTFYLRDFYFDYGNIVKRPDLFVNGPWDFMMKFFEDPDVQGVVGTIKAGNAGVKPYYNYKTKKIINQSEDGRGGNLLVAAHILLATGSLILSFIPTPQTQIASMALDAIDGTLYLTVDKDPYMAGFTWAMMVIPGSEMVRMSKTLKYAEKGSEVALRSFAKRIAKGSEAMMAADFKFLNNVVRIGWETRRFYGGLKTVIFFGIKSLKSDRVIAFIFDLSKAFGWNYTMLRIFYKIWGVTYAYDYVANKLIGRCSQTFAWTDLTGHYLGFKVYKNKPKDIGFIKGKIFDLRNEILTSFDPQKFTQSKQICDALAQIEYLKNLEKQMNSQMKELNDPDYIFAASCENTLLELIKNNQTIESKKNENRYVGAIEQIQNILLLCVGTVKFGLSYEINHYYKLDKNKPSINLKGFFADIESRKNKTFGVAETYDYSTIKFIGVSGIKKIEILSSTNLITKPNKIIKTIYPKGKKELETKKLNVGSQFMFKFEYLDGTIKTSDAITIKPGENFMSGELQKGQFTASKMNWGFFDEFTKIFVTTFQSMYSLSVTGILDKPTLTKLLDVVQEKTCGKIKNISGFELTDEAEWYAQQMAAAEETIKNGPDAYENLDFQLSEQQKKDTIDQAIKYMEDIDTDENRFILLQELEKLKKN